MPFLKRNLDGELKSYNGETPHKNTDEWVVGERDIEEEPSHEPNIECSCGQKELLVCWWDYPHTGGLCKLKCPKCKSEIVLIDNYA